MLFNIWLVYYTIVMLVMTIACQGACQILLYLFSVTINLEKP
jgi:hypothetical protein